jgi:hypothetical protein
LSRTSGTDVDDVVARQIREVAIAEEDPDSAKVWDEAVQRGES